MTAVIASRQGMTQPPDRDEMTDVCPGSLGVLMSAEATRRRAAARHERTESDPDVSIHLTAHAARALLAARGWRQRPKGPWIAPEGTPYWHTAEALAVALEAEAR